MKAYRITGTDIQPLPLVSAYRKGDVAADAYRRQAAGEIPKSDLNLSTCRFVRTILLDDGRFGRLASDEGSLLTVLLSGELTLTMRGGATARLVPGDVFLVDEESASLLGVDAHGACRLLQAGVLPDWPGPGGEILSPGTIVHRNGEPKFTKIVKGDDDLAYFAPDWNPFPAMPGAWSESHQVLGLRFMCWEDGFLDWHPEVVNNFGIILSGELELEVSGDGAAHVFHAGDICVAEDRTGVGHIDRCRGLVHVCLFVLDDEHLW